MLDRTSSSAGGVKAASNQPNKSGIADQIETLRSDIAGLAQKVTGVTKDQLNSSMANVESAAADKANELKSTIQANPMQSLAISVGVGFVLGLVLSR
jgi:ElaB/YqjD/DUF883 family membrane-anchored ribosome-binding protein